MDILKIFLRKVLGVGGVLIALLSLMFVIMGIGDLMGGNAYKTSPSILWGLIIFFLGTLVCGVWMAHWGLSVQQPSQLKLSREEQIKQILQLAQEQQGEISVLEVAAGTQLSLEQSSSLLEELVTLNLAQMRIREDGVLLYDFPEFRHSVSDPQPPGGPS